MKEKTPYLDLPSHFVTNTSVFKDNLKIITNSLIDSIWKERTHPDKLKDTIQSAVFEVYRGGFDEIKELDEEQLYNSFMNSGVNTSRLLTDNNFGLNATNVAKKPHVNAFNAFSQVEEDKTELWASDLYDKPIRSIRMPGEPQETAQYHFQDLKQSIDFIDEETESPRIDLEANDNYKTYKLDAMRSQIEGSEPRRSVRRSLGVGTKNYFIDDSIARQMPFNHNSERYINLPQHGSPKELTGYSQRLRDVPSLSRLKNMTRDASAGSKKMTSIQNKSHSLSKNQSKKSFIQNKEVGRFGGGSLKNLDCLRGSKDEGMTICKPKLQIKPIVDLGAKTPDRSSSKNKSFNFAKEKYYGSEMGIVRVDSANSLIKRIAMDQRVGSTLKKDIVGRHKL